MAAVAMPGVAAMRIPTNHKHATPAHQPHAVIPAKAGLSTDECPVIQWRRYLTPAPDREGDWVSAFAGMTARGAEMTAGKTLRARKHAAPAHRPIARTPLTHSPPHSAARS
ncbi:hypothetical protein GCM10022229_01150 [Luteimonas lutimaris]|uniref:Uncharacterized protein n=1 Tax=Luteimonas lutimaris TaxID=698645 RepID=A0ABP7M4V0_9GAMM